MLNMADISTSTAADTSADTTDAWKCLIIPDYRQGELRAIVGIAQTALESLLLVKAWCRARALFDYRLIVAMLERMAAHADGYVIAFAMSIENPQQQTATSTSTFADDAMDVCDLLREQYASIGELKPYIAEMHQSACVGHRRAIASLEQVFRFSRELGKITARLPRENVSEGRSQSSRSSSERGQSPVRSILPEANAVRKANRDFALFAKRFAIFVDWWGLMKHHLQDLQDAEDVYVVEDQELFARARDQWRSVKDKYKIGESKMRLLSESGRGARNDSITSVTNPELQQRILSRKPSITTSVGASDSQVHLSRRPSNSSSKYNYNNASFSSSSPNGSPHIPPARTRHQSLQHAKSWATSSETLRSPSPELLFKDCTSISSIYKQDTVSPGTASATSSLAYPIKRFSSFQDSLPVPSAEELQARRLRKIESEEKTANRAFRFEPPGEGEMGINHNFSRATTPPRLPPKDNETMRPRMTNKKPTIYANNVTLTSAGGTRPPHRGHHPLRIAMHPPPSPLDEVDVQDVSCWTRFLSTLGFKRKSRKTKPKMVKIG